MEGTMEAWLRAKGGLPRVSPEDLAVGEFIQRYLDEQAQEISQLRREVDRGAGQEGQVKLAKLERQFWGKDDEVLEDLEEDAKLNPARGYFTGDPEVDRLEREFAETGIVPDF